MMMRAREKGNVEQRNKKIRICECLNYTRSRCAHGSIDNFYLVCYFLVLLPFSFHVRNTFFGPFHNKAYPTITFLVRNSIHFDLIV